MKSVQSILTHILLICIIILDDQALSVNASSSSLQSSSQQQQQPQHIGILDSQHTQFHVGDGSVSTTKNVNPSVIVLTDPQGLFSNSQGDNQYYYRFSIRPPGCVGTSSEVTILQQYGSRHGYRIRSKSIELQLQIQAWSGTDHDKYNDQSTFAMCLQADLLLSNKESAAVVAGDEDDLIERKFFDFSVQAIVASDVATKSTKLRGSRA